MPRRHFVYLTEADVSVNYGRGINEREFVRSLLERHGDEVTCIVPAAANPGNYSDARLKYVTSHEHSGLDYPRFLLDSWKRVRSLHRERPIDALVVRLDVTPVVPYAAHRLLDIPIILKGLINRQSFGPREYGSYGPTDLAKRIFRGMFRTVITEAIAADTVSGTIADALRHEFRFEGKLTVVPNGANLESFRPGPRQEVRRELELERFDFLVGYMGTITEFRELDAVAEAFRGIEAQNAGLVIVGDGPYREELASRCSKLGIRDRVHFTGWVPYERIPTYLQALDVGIDLSRVPFEYAGTRRFATYSQKLAQYLGTGVPVLAWRLDDTAFLEDEDIGAVADVGSVGGLTEGMNRLLSNGTERKRRSARARRYAEANLAASVLTDRRVRMWRQAVSESVHA